MSDETTDEDLAAAGLIGESYDSVFEIRTRVRKIQDIEIPVRGGLLPSQFGAFIFGLIGTILTYGLLVKPFFSLIGVGLHWIIIVAYIFGPPILAAQRIVKPMRYGKTIPSTYLSWWHDITDNKVHARGLPVPDRPEDSVEGPTLVYQRVWVPAEEATEPEETDERAERLLDGFVPDTEQWAIAKAEEHITAWRERERREAEQREKVSSTRSRGGSVIDDEEMAS